MRDGSDGHGGARPEVVTLADVEPAEVPWLWPGLIPLGAITLLVGDPGKGKSMVSLDIAARVSTGRPFPGPTEPRVPAGVVLLGAEDALNYTVRPRLDVLGADVSRVHVIRAVLDKRRRRPVSLETDLQAVEGVLAERRAQLLIIDPLSAYLGRNVNSWKDSDVRRIMDPLADLGARVEIAVLGVVHLNKATERDALHRSQGSTAFVAAARSVLALAPDPDEQDHKTRRVLVHVKCNLAPVADAWMLDVTPPLRWLSQRADVETSQALAPKRTDDKRGRRECEAAVRSLVPVLPLPASEARRRVLELVPGAADRTIDRARAAVGVTTLQPSTVGGEWIWCAGGDTGGGDTGEPHASHTPDAVAPSRQVEIEVATRGHSAEASRASRSVRVATFRVATDSQVDLEAEVLAVLGPIARPVRSVFEEVRVNTGRSMDDIAAALARKVATGDVDQSGELVRVKRRSA